MKYFFVGVHNLQHLDILPQCCISFLRLRQRRKELKLNDWIMDNGAFSQISSDGDYSVSISEYASKIKRWSSCGNLLAAVSQDFMCEPEILTKCRATVREQQFKTCDRYHKLLNQLENVVYLLPVLQGWHPEDYLSHLAMYDFAPNSWVGVGSVCRRQRSAAIEQIVGAIKNMRPDLRLHLFGVKTSALSFPLLHHWIYSADSAAWSYAARREGRDRNSIQEALAFWTKIKGFDDGLFAML